MPTNTFALQKQPSVPEGFQFSGIHCGIKSNPEKEDLTIILSDRAATACGVYTENLVRAAPVTLDQARTPSRDIRAVVINSGNGIDFNSPVSGFISTNTVVMRPLAASDDFPSREFLKMNS